MKTNKKAELIVIIAAEIAAAEIMHAGYFDDARAVFEAEGLVAIVESKHGPIYQEES